MPGGPVLTVIITSVNEGLDKGLVEAEKKIGGFGAKAGGKLAKVAKVAAPVAGVAAAVAKLGSAADKAATDTAGFNAAMIASGASADDLAGPLKDAQKASKDLAFSGAQTKDALIALNTATGDTQTSVELLAVAQDVARLSGSDLETASNAVAKAFIGNDKALRTLIPGLEAGATGMETIENASAAAAGQADIFAESAEATGIKTKAALKGLAITIGKAVGPAFKAMLEALLPVVEALALLVESILPLLIPLINKIAKGFEIAAKAISKVVEVVAKLITKVRELLAPLDAVAEKIRNIDLNPFKSIGNAVAVAPSVGAGTQAAGSGSSRGGGVTFNIYGDPAVIEAKVTKALRDYTRRNGAGAVFSAGRR